MCCTLWLSQLKTQSHNWTVNDRIHADLCVSASFRVVDGQNAIPDYAGEVPSSELKIVGATKHLPAEFTARAETTDVASELKFVLRRDLMANDRVDSLNSAGLGNRPCASHSYPFLGFANCHQTN
jgi:hypothetical protein